MTSDASPVTARDRGDPEEVSYDSERHKRPSDDTQVVQVQADALLAPATNRDNLSDVYFIGELTSDWSVRVRWGQSLVIAQLSVLFRRGKCRTETPHRSGPVQFSMIFSV